MFSYVIIYQCLIEGITYTSVVLNEYPTEDMIKQFRTTPETHTDEMIKGSTRQPFYL